MCLSKEQVPVVLVFILLIAACSLVSPQPLATGIPDTAGPVGVYTPTNTITLAPPTASPQPTQTASPVPSLTLPPTLASCPSQKLLFPSVYLDDKPVVGIRQGPGCEYEPIPYAFFKTTPLDFWDVIGKQGDWWLVDLCNNRSGWIFGPVIAGNNVLGTVEDIPEIPLSPTPANAPTPLPPVDEREAIDEAAKTLVTLFSLLHDKRYEEATRIFGGGYGIVINWNPDVDPHDYPALLMSGCESNGFMCFLRVNRIIEGKQVSPMSYVFTVELVDDDGKIYRRNNPLDPSGASDSQFVFHVVRDCEGKYYVIDWPLYETYGG